ncbi:MAG: CsgG/HfaB family protein [Spirochaetota bacterium]
MQRFRFLFVLFFLSFISTAFSEDKVTIAVLDFAPNGVPKIVSNAISEIFRSEFINIGNFVVVERAQMEEILKEQELQMSGCTDSACAVQFGKLLSARKIVVGEVSSITKSILINVRYVDVESGVSLFSSRGESPSIDDVDKTAADLAKDLAHRIISGDKDILTPLSKTGYYARSIVPGLGQFYVGRKVNGCIFMGSFILSGAFMGYSIYNYTEKRSTYEKTPDGSPVSTYEKNYKESKDSATMAKISIGAFALVYTLNLVDVFFFSSHYLDKKIGKLENANESSISFNINLNNNKNYYQESYLGASIVKKF